MATSVKQMMDAANAAVPRITPAQAKEMIAGNNTLVIDVRDAPEVAKSGKVAGAINVSRGMLEFRADPETPYYDQSFDKGETLISIARPAGARRSPARCSRIWAIPKCTISAPSRTGPRVADWWKEADRAWNVSTQGSCFGVRSVQGRVRCDR
jgi:Rhodanese-like domain